MTRRNGKKKTLGRLIRVRARKERGNLKRKDGESYCKIKEELDESHEGKERCGREEQKGVRVEKRADGREQER